MIDSKKIKKKKVTGFYDSNFDKTNEILVVKWGEDNCVSLAINAHRILSLSSEQI